MEQFAVAKEVADRIDDIDHQRRADDDQIRDDVFAEE